MASRLIVFFFIAIVQSVFWSAPSAQAQEEDPIEQARADFQRAVELEQASDYAGALRLFRKVGQVKMTPQVRYHIATCEENLGKMVAALGGYRLALQHSEGMHPGFIQEVEQSISYLEQRIPKLVVTRGEGAEAASISLDGVGLGAKLVGTEIPLDPGPHVVTATAQGYEDFSLTVTMREGETEELVLELSPEAPEPAPVPEPVAPVEQPRGYGKTPYIVGGAGIALIAVGGVFLGINQAKVGELKTLCPTVDEDGAYQCGGLMEPDRSRAESLRSEAIAFEAIGWAMMVGGTLGVATGTVMYFIDPARRAEKTSSARLRFELAAPRADVGFSLSGRF